MSYVASFRLAAMKTNELERLDLIVGMNGLDWTAVISTRRAGWAFPKKIYSCESRPHINFKLNWLFSSTSATRPSTLSLVKDLHALLPATVLLKQAALNLLTLLDRSVDLCATSLRSL